MPEPSLLSSNYDQVAQTGRKKMIVYLLNLKMMIVKDNISDYKLASSFPARNKKNGI